MNSLYKIKLLASGKPEGIDFDSFLKDMLDKEGIDLQGCTFHKNPGMRYIAKLLLNSFWGSVCNERKQTSIQICC